jgi:hypothetical protein
MAKAINDNGKSNNSTHKHFLIQRDDCRIMFQFGKLTQDLIETDNGRPRTRVKHFIEHLQGMLKSSDFGP